MKASELYKRASDVKRRLLEARKRGASDSEIDALVTEANNVSAEIDEYVIAKKIDHMEAAGKSRGGYSMARKARETEGFAAGRKVSFGWKAAIIDDPAEAGPMRQAGIRGLPLDERYVFPNIPAADLAGATMIEALVAQNRTLAAPASMQIGLTAGTQKPETTVGATLDQVEPVMVATVSEPIANAIIEKPAFATLVDVTLRQAYREALDDLVIDALILGAGTTDNTGADDFIRLRKAVTNLQSKGFSPDLAVVSPTLAESLDLARAGGSAAGDGAFLLSPAPRDAGFSPLFGMRIIPAKSVADPIVIDSRSAARLYLGDVDLSANPFERFRENETRFRLEGAAALVIEQPDAVHVVAAAGS